jgi:IS5 family transposase
VVALQQARDHQELHEGVRVRTLGADKGYHQKGFVTGCRQANVVPHVACKAGVKVAGLDGRTTTKESYRISQRVRKRVEEIFGWMKTVGGLRRSRYRGRERTQAWGYFVAATYNLVRLAKLGAGPPMSAGA